jgi:hypothetical protein
MSYHDYLVSVLVREKRPLQCSRIKSRERAVDVRGNCAIEHTDSIACIGTKSLDYRARSRNEFAFPEASNLRIRTSQSTLSTNLRDCRLIKVSINCAPHPN